MHHPTRKGDKSRALHRAWVRGWPQIRSQFVSGSWYGRGERPNESPAIVVRRLRASIGWVLWIKYKAAAVFTAANQVEEMMRFFHQKSGNNRKFEYSNFISTDAVNKTTTC
jgi:hypothetical protein